MQRQFLPNRIGTLFGWGILNVCFFHKRTAICVIESRHRRFELLINIFRFTWGEPVPNIEILQDLIRRLHGYDAVHLMSLSISETFPGKTIGDGEVELF